MASEMIVTVTVSTISPLKPTHTDKDSSLSLTVYEVCSKLTDTSAKNYKIGYSLCICMYKNLPSLSRMTIVMELLVMLTSVSKVVSVRLNDSEVSKMESSTISTSKHRTPLDCEGSKFNC